jgi:hypothetical protein
MKRLPTLVRTMFKAGALPAFCDVTMASSSSPSFLPVKIRNSRTFAVPCSDCT